jgi:hypothetical protein
MSNVILLDNIKRLEQYTILSSIRPVYKQRKYPYNPFTSEKITFTLNELVLQKKGKSNVFISYDNNSMQQKDKKGGVEDGTVLVMLM